MIVFFSSCELVEFHYHLFLQTLLSGLGAPAPGQPPSGCTLLKFLRLHGNMDQEVSGPRSVQLHVPSRSAPAASGLGQASPGAGSPWELLEAVTLPAGRGQREPIVLPACSGSWAHPPESSQATWPASTSTSCYGNRAPLSSWHQGRVLPF